MASPPCHPPAAGDAHPSSPAVGASRVYLPWAQTHWEWGETQVAGEPAQTGTHFRLCRLLKPLEGQPRSRGHSGKGRCAEGSSFWEEVTTTEWAAQQVPRGKGQLPGGAGAEGPSPAWGRARTERPLNDGALGHCNPRPGVPVLARGSWETHCGTGPGHVGSSKPATEGVVTPQKPANATNQDFAEALLGEPVKHLPAHRC